MKKSKEESIDFRAPISEAYKTLRSNIQFSSLDKKIQTLVVTSSGPGEGKTTTSCSLAIAMAQAGKKTVLIDCDLRKPSVHRNFKLSNERGLSTLLIGESKQSEVIQKTWEENLDVITLGVRPPNPSELLESVKMRNFLEALKETYEYIILDTPPVIMVTDALILAQFSDGCILVVAAGETHKEAIKKSKKLITNVNGHILGVVLNKLDLSKRKYFGYDQYYYNYGYVEEQKKKRSFFKKKESSLSE